MISIVAAMLSQQALRSRVRTTAASYARIKRFVLMFRVACWRRQLVYTNIIIAARRANDDAHAAETQLLRNYCVLITHPTARIYIFSAAIAQNCM